MAFLLSRIFGTVSHAPVPLEHMMTSPIVANKLPFIFQNQYFHRQHPPPLLLPAFSPIHPQLIAYLSALLLQMRFADLSRNQIESPPAVSRRWPVLQHLILSRNPLKGRQSQFRRLLQAAQRGDEAMHRGVGHNLKSNAVCRSS